MTQLRRPGPATWTATLRPFDPAPHLNAGPVQAVFIPLRLTDDATKAADSYFALVSGPSGDDFCPRAPLCEPGDLECPTFWSDRTEAPPPIRISFIIVSHSKASSPFLKTANCVAGNVRLVAAGAKNAIAFQDSVVVVVVRCSLRGTPELHKKLSSFPKNTSHRFLVRFRPSK
jgi:hypothetical protein